MLIDFCNLRALARERKMVTILQEEVERLQDVRRELELSALARGSGGPSFMDVSTRMPGEEAQKAITQEAVRLMAPILARDAMASLAVAMDGRQAFHPRGPEVLVAGEDLGGNMLYRARITIPEISTTVEVLS